MTTTVIFAAVIVRIILVNFTTSSDKDWRSDDILDVNFTGLHKTLNPTRYLQKIAEDTPCTLATAAVCEGSGRCMQMPRCTLGKRRDLCLGSIWWYAGCCNTAVCKEMSKMALLKHEPGAAQKATILYNCIHLLKLGWIDVDILELFEEFAAFAWYAYLQVPQHCPTVNISKVIHSAFTAV